MRALPAFVCPALVAAALIATGTHDLESYENAFVSLNRGTEMAAVAVAGQPVYTLSLGLGARLPLHGNLGASPAAILARALPAPAAHGLLLTLSMTAAALVVLRAVGPVAGQAVVWGVLSLLFASLPMVAYTVHNDWPETAVTYCALVAGMFAPHAWLAASGRGLQRVGLLAVVASLVASAHPGYWTQLAAALVVSGLLTLVVPTGQSRDRWMALIGLGAAALAGVAIHIPDLLQELALGAGLGRDAQGATEALLTPHLFPFAAPGARDPFMLLPLSLAAIICAAGDERRWRSAIVGSAVASVAFGFGAASLQSSQLGPDSLAPTAAWALRDPAAVFAVMSSAFAAVALRRTRTSAWTRAGMLLLVAASAQGVGYAAALLRQPPQRGITPWNHEASTPAARLRARGMPPTAGERLALWPGVRAEMRASGRPSTDWADAGQPLVTAWTKNRTTATLVGPNGFVFDQSLDLPARALCDAPTVAFLRLRYLVAPAGERCAGWIPTSTRIDERWTLATWVGGEDARVRTIPMTAVNEGLRRQPALEAGAGLMARLAPEDGTSVVLDTVRHTARITGPVGGAQAIVLPIAYDPGWRVSSGRTIVLGGLLAIVEATPGDVRLWFEPDAALRIRAMGMMLGQVLGAFGILALAVSRKPAPNNNVA